MCNKAKLMRISSVALCASLALKSICSTKFTNPLPRPYHAATRGLTSLPSLPGHYHGKPLVKPLLGPGKPPPFICSGRSSLQESAAAMHSNTFAWLMLQSSWFRQAFRRASTCNKNEAFFGLVTADMLYVQQITVRTHVHSACYNALKQLPANSPWHPLCSA